MSAIRIDEKVVFNVARQIGDASARENYLKDACGDDAVTYARICDLLRVYELEQSFLESPADTAHLPTVAATVRPNVTGVRIGPYKLLQQIGEGGMGVVYMAEQTHPVQRRVAIKLVKPGLDNRQVIARFEAERQALALMDHPNIAKVLDAGSTDTGQPYFVMELVNGLPLTTFCDERRLTPRERLELFIPVCQAVQHAHQKGIIHRDLKPSNVVVALYDGRPVPKVIDFGVAKATGSKLTDKTMFTEFGALVGTLQYMSPEQAERNQVDIDTRSDIYSLGVLLYELLTGTTPIDKKRLKGAAVLELMQIIKEEEPQKPSTRLSTTDELPSIAANRSLEPKRLGHLVRGDLDWIVMKALEKDRNRRYDTVNGFAADIGRYLDHEPVEACPPSAGYRLRKFLRRNRTALVTTGLVCLALVVGTAVSVWQTIEAIDARKLADERLERETKALEDAVKQRQEADEQRQLAESNFQKALNAVDQMLTRVADEKLGHIRGAEPVRKELLEQALQFYEQFLAQRSDDSHLQFEVAKAWQRVGFIKYLLSDWLGSVQALGMAIDIAETQLRDFPDDVKYLELLAESCAKQGLALQMTEPGPREFEVLGSGIAAIERLQQLVSDNIGYRRIASELKLSLGELLSYTGTDNQKSIDLLWDAVHIHRKLLEDDGQRWGDRARLMMTLRFLAVHIARRDFDQADQLLGEAEELGRDLPAAEQIGAPDSQYNDPIVALSSALAFRAILHMNHQRGNPEVQEAWLRRAMALANEQRAAHPKAVFARYCWGCVIEQYAAFLENAGRTDEAERFYRDILRELLVDYKVDYQHRVKTSVDQLTAILQKSGRQDDKELARFKLQFFENDAFPMEWYMLTRRAAFRFESQRYREALEDLATAVEKNPSDTLKFTWIPPAAIAACPDESFRTGILALADQTIERTNGDGAAYVYRAALQLAMANTSAAKKDLDAGISSAKVGHFTRYQHALLCLATDDLAGYRADCAELLRQFADSQDLQELRFAAWTTAIVPDAIPDVEPAIVLARRAVEVSSASRAALQALGSILFRAGRYEEALSILERAEAAANDDSTLPSYNWYFLAMTHQKLGRSDEARSWYDQACQSTTVMLNDVNKTLSWNRRLTLELLRREADALFPPVEQPVSATEAITTTIPLKATDPKSH